MNQLKFLVGVLLLIFNQLSAIESKFIQYPSEEDSLIIIEKVYLHVDSDNFLADDDIWFKAYLIDALDHLLTDHSNNLHVELISPSSKIISSRIIRLEGGLGNGDFKLPADIKSGRYRLRAYTNYMRNFSDQLFFSKEITVTNATDGSETVTDEVEYLRNDITLNFFPEGGSLVDNVSSVVAFKPVDNSGMGCEVSGKVYSSSGDLITSFRSSHHGMGSFLLRPLPGLKYYSVFRGADSINRRAELPMSFPQGATLSVSKNQNNELMVSVKTNSETLPALSENDLLLTISIRGEVINTLPIRIKSLNTSFVVPTSYLPEGILMLTLAAREKLPIAERLVYLERYTPLKILIETDKQTYKKREPVNLKISLSGDSMTETEGNVSLAVVDETFTNNTSQFPRNISSWFLLESDIRGNVEDPSYYFNPTIADRLRNLDLLLLTQGWRDFSWKYDTVNYPVENGFTICGKLRQTRKNLLFEDYKVSIGIFGDNNSLLTNVPVDSDGRFELRDIDFTGQATLIASAIDNKNNLKGTLTFDSARYLPAKILETPDRVKVFSVEKQNSFKSYYLISDSIKRKYKLSDTITIGEVNIISERHKDPQTVKVESSRSKYGIPDAELKITEQMQGFSSLLDILRAGTIAGVVVSIDNTIYIRGNSSINAINPPLLLIDGIPIFPGDTSNQLAMNELMTLSISLVDRIDVLKSVFATNMYGILGANGVINVITKAGGAGSYNTTGTHIKDQDFWI